MYNIWYLEWSIKLNLLQANFRLGVISAMHCIFTEVLLTKIWPHVNTLIPYGELKTHIK